jgi:hypothetical protein
MIRKHTEIEIEVEENNDAISSLRPSVSPPLSPSVSPPFFLVKLSPNSALLVPLDLWAGRNGQTIPIKKTVNK